MRIHVMIVLGLFGIAPGKVTSDKTPQDMRSTAAVIDGPYVFYRNDSIIVNYIDSNAGTASVRTEIYPASARETIQLHVNSDVSGRVFQVKLKSKLSNEKPEHNGVKKMLVISDIEGNLAALRKLLIAAQVINENLDWTFNKDHVVFTGDFMDRGDKVTEVLWFIYALEEKAKAAGGYVHFILGNHEIMNMTNDIRYVNERYLKHAALLNKPYIELYGATSELGRWMATKNVVERVGSVLFAHGGISADINNMQISLRELNNITRPWYMDTSYEFKDQRLHVIYGDTGPFWYRGYYTNPRASVAQIDSTLYNYNVRHIATGHTIVAKEISSLFNGKLLNTDVHHADGHSEALLIENGKFRRITANGEKHELNAIQ